MNITTTVKDREHEFGSDFREQIVERFSSLSKLLPEATYLDIMLEHKHRQRQSDKTSIMHATLTLPGEKQPFHATEEEGDFKSALDALFNKVNNHCRRWHERRIEKKHNK